MPPAAGGHDAPRTPSTGWLGEMRERRAAERRSVWSGNWPGPAGRKAGQHVRANSPTTGASGEAPHFKKS